MLGAQLAPEKKMLVLIPVQYMFLRKIIPKIIIKYPPSLFLYCYKES